MLKRLEDALADGDGIRAVILGVGINNDGSDKVGYTAPGIRGQAVAVAAAYEAAGITPDTVGYVEAHGTGTILGDPIEISALTEVFREHTDRRGFCGIGSVKSNFGHLSCASGVAGLIKTVLILEHGAIPPTLHYESPNPAIDFASSPFYVTDKLEPWVQNGSPRRAAVSSFGVGGTNAHAVLEEAPLQPATTEGRTAVLLTLSAKSEPALDTATRRLGEHLDRHPEQDLADAAFTLHVGRRTHRFRRTVAAERNDRAGVVAVLDEAVHVAASEVVGGCPVVFMFPGQGSQYPGMAAELYATEALVRDTIDHCCETLRPDLGLDLREVLFPSDDRREAANAELRDTALAQPALFVVEYALSELWRSWGVQPDRDDRPQRRRVRRRDALRGHRPRRCAAAHRRTRPADLRRCLPAACCRCMAPRLSRWLICSTTRSPWPRSTLQDSPCCPARPRRSKTSSASSSRVRSRRVASTPPTRSTRR